MKVLQVAHRIAYWWRKLSKYEKAVIALATTFVMAFSCYTLALHYSFKTTGGDLGQYTQAFWTFIFQGKPFIMNDRVSFRNPTGSYFGEHFAPILLLLTPLFALLPLPETLLIIKALAQGLAIIPLFLLTRELTKNEKTAFIVALAYAFNPHLFIARVFDFQEQCLLPLLIFSAYLAYLRSRKVFFVLFTVLTLMVNEFIGFMMFGFLLALLFRDIRVSDLRRPVKLIRTLRSRDFLTKLALTILALLWILPAHIVRGMFNGEGAAVTYAAVFPIEIEDRTPWGITKTIILNPQALIGAMSYDAWMKVLGILAFLTPYLALPLTKLTFLLPALPYLVFALLTSQRSVYTFGAHYSFYLAPFALIALAEALQNISGNDNYREKPTLVNSGGGYNTLLRALVVTSVVGSILVSAWLISIGQTPSFDDHITHLNEVLKLIPSDASILTQNNIFPHLATRSNSYTCNDPRLCKEMLTLVNILHFDYILLDYKSTAWGVRWAGLLEPYVTDVLRSEEFGVLASFDGIMLAKRGYKGSPVLHEPVEEVYDGSHFYVEHGSKAFDTRTSTFIVVHKIGDGVGTIWFGPYRHYPPGTYKVTYYIRMWTTDYSSMEPLLKLDVVAERAQRTLAKKYIYASNVMNETIIVSLEFASKSWLFDIEFRGEALTNDVYVALEHVEVEQVSMEPKDFIDIEFAANELPVKCGKYVNGLLVHEPGNCEGTFWYGPYITLPPGNYTVEFWIKVDHIGEVSDPVMIFDVSANNGRTILAESRMPTANITLGSWARVTLRFALSSTMKAVEFRCRHVATDTIVYLWKARIFGGLT